MKVGLYTIKKNMGTMCTKNLSEPVELSDMAKETIAKAIHELNEEPSPTFDDIDELFDDLESD